MVSGWVSGPPSSAVTRAFRNGFRNFSRLSVRAGSSCPLLGAPLALKGDSKTHPRRVDCFANVFCVARLPKTIAKPIVFHYFLFFIFLFARTPQDAPKTLQVAPRYRMTLPRRPQDAPRRPQDASKMPPRRLQDAPKTPPGHPQDAPKRPKTPQDVPRRPKTAPRRLQDAPKTPQGVPKTRASPIFWYHCAPSNPLLTCYQFYWFYRAIVSVMIHCTSGSVGFINPLSAVPFPKVRAAALAEGLYNL